MAYGPASGEALARRIASIKGAEPLSAVTVVVPSNQVGVAVRRRLAGGGAGPTATRGNGVAAVTFVTPYRLAEQLAAPALAGTGRRPVSVPVIAAALRASLLAEPGVFAPVAAHPATESALVATYRELREVPDPGLDAIRSSGRRAAEVVRLHRAARTRLEPHWYDEQDLMATAARVLRAEGTGDLGSLVVYLPQRLTPHAIDLLAAAGEISELTVLVGTTGSAEADAEVAASIARLAPRAAAPPARPTGDLAHLVDAERTRVIATSDADDEVRHAVRAVIDAVRAGTPLDRIAVLHASPEPYARLAHEHLDAAGIASNGPSVIPLSARIAGRVLLDGFALAARGYRRQDLFAWLTAAPVRVGTGRAPVLAWERLSRDAGVVSGDDWDARLVLLADGLDAAAAAAHDDPDAPDWRAERDRIAAERARRLRSYVLGLQRELDPETHGPRSWTDHAAWAIGFLHRTLGGADHWATWPDRAETKAAQRVEDAIHRLGTLAEVEGPVTQDVFSRTLALELDADLGRVGRFGDGVMVGPISLAIGLDLDLVVVLGLAEGTFPATVHDDSLLPDDERAAAGTALAPRAARVERQHRELRAALAGARRHRLSFPRGDLRRSADRIPSRWLLDIASQLAGSRLWSRDLLSCEADWLTHVASFDSGLRTVAFPATEQEHRLRSLMADGDTHNAVVDAGDPILRAGVRMVVARRSDTYTRFDGNVSGVAVVSPVERPTSASRMETWAKCPFAYFMAHVLGVDEIENPEDVFAITPIDRGNLVHDALERFIKDVLARPEAARPAPDQPWTAGDRLLLRSIAEGLCDAYEAEGRTGRPLFWGRDRVRILADLDRFLDADDAHRREHRTRPLAAELAFGLGGELGAVSLPMADGRTLAFRGKADRVDLADDGTLHVVDYKTGKPHKYASVSVDDPDVAGTRLQLPIYGAAARAHHRDPTAAVQAEYWFISTAGDFRRIGYRVTDEVVARVGETLATIVAGVEAGVFASHPTTGASSQRVECAACDPDGLGVAELRRAWERKRSDPALAPYAELAEPLTANDVIDETGGTTS